LHRGRIYVSNSQELKTLILKEMHNVPYFGHQGYQKTIKVPFEFNIIWSFLSNNL
jgi:hypothetical protein